MFSSNTPGGSNPDSSVTSNISFDIESTFQESLIAAPTYKSLTFARTSLLPSFGQSTPPKINDDKSSGFVSSISEVEDDENLTNFEFYSRILAEFTASYFEATTSQEIKLISREKWRADEEVELKLRRQHEEQRAQFSRFHAKGSSGVSNKFSVDFRKRPDCMDDLVALAVDVCALSPPCAMCFWNTTSLDIQIDESMGNVRLFPSLALRALESLQMEDESLFPSYLSFLAALSLAKPLEYSCSDLNGASMVHTMLMPSDSHSDDINWHYLLEIIQWYIDQLNRSSQDQKGSSSTGYSTTHHNSSSSMFESSAYYYDASDDQPQYNSSSKYSTFTRNNQEMDTSMTELDYQTRSKTSLGENHTLGLLSVLALISRIASSSEDARKYLISLRVSSRDDKRYDDEILTILFTLLTMPVSSDIKGEVFSALSALVKNDYEAASKGWELLEASQVVPTLLLDQYSTKESLYGGSSVVPSGPSGRFLSGGNLVSFVSPIRPKFKFTLSFFYLIVFLLQFHRLDHLSLFHQVKIMEFFTKWNISSQ